MISAKDNTVSMRHVSGSGGVALTVWDYGGTGPVLLLSHCNSGVGRMWDPVATALLSHFHVLAIDHRGHGASEKPAKKSDYVWSLFAKDMIAVRNELAGDNPAYAAGHSSGAAFLLEAELQQPGSFTGLTLFDPIVGERFSVEGTHPLAQCARKRRRTFMSKEQAYIHFAGKPPMNSWNKDVLAAYIAHGITDIPVGGVELACTPEIEAWIYELGGCVPAIPQLRNISCPVNIFGGGDIFIAEGGELVANALEYGHFEAIPGVSHFIPQEKPELAAEKVAAMKLVQKVQ